MFVALGIGDCRGRKRHYGLCMSSEPTLNDTLWLDAIENAYGVRLEAGQIYAEVNGQVYAGSEYVATLGASALPQDATSWAASIAHLPRALGRMDVATKT
jgi:hypothetical protein